MRKEPITSHLGRSPQHGSRCLPWNRSALGLVISGALLLSGCSAKASDVLLASDLTYREQKDGWTRSVSIDPWLAKTPDLVRQIRDRRIADMESKDMNCSTADGLDCYEFAKFDVQYDGLVFLSVMETTDFYSGGAHGSSSENDHLFDLATGEDIRFGDIFESWATVRPQLQTAFCKQLAERDEAYECPDIQKQAITLQAEPPGVKVYAFVITTQDYAIGSFADGHVAISVEITKAMYRQIKPQYRADFEVPLWN